MTMLAEDARKLANKYGNRTLVDEQIEIIDKHIKSACLNGKTKTAFVGSGGSLNQVKDDVKEHYLKLGYRFKPIGFEGGVYQEDEWIMW